MADTTGKDGANLVAPQEAEELARLSKRYPSVPGLSRAEELRIITAAGAPKPANATEAEEQRLAKRYPSLMTRADPTSVASPGATGPKDAEAAKSAGPGVPDFVDQSSPAFGAFQGLAKELGIADEHRSKILDVYRQDRQAQEDAWTKQVEEWRSKVEADPEITAGADGMRAFVAEHGGKEFINALGDLGNHPAVIRGLVRMAAAMKKGRR